MNPAPTDARTSRTGSTERVGAPLQVFELTTLLHQAGEAKAAYPATLTEALGLLAARPTIRLPAPSRGIWRNGFPSYCSLVVNLQ